ncbi:unnamed protein product, partial [Enterobius vermicularis]|uniref:ERAP1_C domain-containing protein n=1 Tax=Enterobius vermicularis TaxID=51028 RepID=A0A0N4VQX8_ENTVE
PVVNRNTQVEVPSFNILRRAGNIIAQFIYRNSCEKNYTLDGLLNGAAYIAGIYINEKNWERLRAIMIEDSVEDIRERVEALTDEEVSNLRFLEDDVIASFLHLSCFASRSLLGGNYSNFHPELLITRKFYRLSRCVFPVGIWRIHKINFFDPASKPNLIDVGLYR